MIYKNLHRGKIACNRSVEPELFLLSIQEDDAEVTSARVCMTRSEAEQLIEALNRLLCKDSRCVDKTYIGGTDERSDHSS